MSQLKTLKDLGVTTLSVTDNLATAVNPYEIDSKEYYLFAYHISEFRKDLLPPLPTSGIPDGTVSIEEVEEEKQWLCSDGKWYKCMGLVRDYDTIRTALVKKQVKEEEPKTATEIYIKKLHSFIDPTLYPDKPIEYRISRLSEYAKSNMIPIQAQEQTAEGIEAIKDEYAISQGFPNWEALYGKHVFQISKFEKHTDNVAKRYAESQLAQYKEKLIGEMENVKDPSNYKGLNIAVQIVKSS